MESPSFLVLKMSDPTIRELRKTYAKWKDIAGHHIGSFPAGNRSIEEGVIYRIK